MDMKEYKKQYYLRNREKLLALQAKRRKLNEEIYKQRNAAYRAANPEKVKASRDAWRKANQNWKRLWDSANLDKHRANAARRKAVKVGATPKWANEFFISEAYRLATLRTKVTGLPWEVDHIVPLRSKKVCGLHVEHNLRVIQASKNLSKGNRYWPDMP